MAEISSKPAEASRAASAKWNALRLAQLYGRLALGSAFLSAVGGRFGLWSGHPAGESFQKFIARTAEVNAFLPAALSPFLAWAATCAEIFLGIALIAGVWRRPVAFASAVLLAMFATAMTISLGIKPPLDYSVYSASAAALLLALSYADKKGKSA